MTSVEAATAAAPTPAAAKHFHWQRWLVIILVILVIGAAADLLGWDLKGWFEELWDTITGISLADLLAAITLKTVQTAAAAFAYYSILRYAYPGRVHWLQIFATYAISVGLNSILPANLGTAVMVIMLTLIIPGATFAGILAVYGVQKIFFVVIGAFPYLYLFFTVGGSFDIQFKFIKDHPWAVAVILIGGAILISLLIRMFWPRVLKWWDQAKEGGQILVHPRAYFLRVVTPEAISWIASLCVIAVFLSAYAIPVTFHTIMRIVAGNSIANVTSVTPGGAGVTQAFNVASLNGVTSATNATAYSVAQQLVTTAWNLVLAIVLMIWAFGWSGGKLLVEQSYGQAKEEQAKRKAAHEAKKQAQAAEEAAERA
jgi:uncharacterized membrane protein YbhN (UPF0104 family)